MTLVLLLLAVGCFVLMCLTKSLLLGAVCMLLALVFMVMATLMFLSSRVGNVNRNANILSAEELRVLREQADAKRQGAGTSTTGGTQASDH